MPANLKTPFADSCCDGGSTTLGTESCRPCGCDLGCKPKPYFCAEHRYQQTEKLNEQNNSTKEV